MTEINAKNRNKKKLEDRLLVYGSYTNFIQNIKHFDILQTSFRIMTSSALLATFAAIGFILSAENKNLPFNGLIAVILICLFGLLAIVTLWHLDLILYERLLISNFAEALRLENKHTWLPKVHHNMLHGHSKQDKPANVVLYYIGCGSSLILTAGAALACLLKNSGISTMLTIVFSTIFFAILYFLFLKKSTKSIKAQIKVINNLNGKNHDR
jgi:hypothetical protein